MSESIVPKGYLCYKFPQQLSISPYFKGLSRHEASNMTNFELFRYPIKNRNKNGTDSFDTINDLIPFGRCFTFNINDQNVCIIRSLKWKGMTFLHKLNTSQHGCYYFGNGKQNIDFLF